MRILIPIICFVLLLNSGCTAFGRKMCGKYFFSEKKPNMEICEDYAFIDFDDFDHDVYNIDNGIVIKCKASNPLMYLDLKAMAEDFREKACEICRDVVVSNTYNNPFVEIRITSEHQGTVRFLQKIAHEKETKPDDDYPIVDKETDFIGKTDQRIYIFC